MIILLQRVTQANVTVDEQVIAAIDQGILAFVGIEKTDTKDSMKKIADKLLQYRVFSDDQNKMNLNVQQVNGGILLVPQFTLAADTQSGLRPSFSSAASPNMAKALFIDLVDYLSQQYDTIAKGEFGADMAVSLCNDGPVTFILN